MSTCQRTIEVPGQKAYTAPGPEPELSPIIYTPSPSKATRLGRLSSLIQRFRKPKSAVNDKRGVASFDVTRPAAKPDVQPTLGPDAKFNRGVHNVTGRRSESRILAFLGSRRQSCECDNNYDTTGTITTVTTTTQATKTNNNTTHNSAVVQPAPPLPRALLETTPPSQGAACGLDSLKRNPLCAVTISGPLLRDELRARTTATAEPQPRIANFVQAFFSAKQLSKAASVLSTATATLTSNTSVASGATATFHDAVNSAKASMDTPEWPSQPSPPVSGQPALPTHVAVPFPTRPQSTAATPCSTLAAALSTGVTPIEPSASGGSGSIASGPAGVRAFQAPRSVLPHEPLLVLAPEDSSRVLAVCPGTPVSMRRLHWSLEDYCVRRRLSKSPTSSVYEANCRRSGLPVALKVYNLALVPLNVLHMLWREIQIQTFLTHPHIVMLYGAFQDLESHQLVLVEEFASNGDLHEVHRSLGWRMSESQVRILVLQPLLEAVTTLHAAGVVHRDIKPDNILFTADWRLVLADFGVSIDTSLERAVTRVGTVGYMAPEVERCPIKSYAEENKEALHLAYTMAADVWAIGCLAYMLLLGFPPFLGPIQRAYRGAPGQARADSGSGFSSSGLTFPASTSLLARDFICLALAEEPEDRPTALQLMRHPWLRVVER